MYYTQYPTMNYLTSAGWIYPNCISLNDMTRQKTRCCIIMKSYLLSTCVDVMDQAISYADFTLTYSIL